MRSGVCRRDYGWEGETRAASVFRFDVDGLELRTWYLAPGTGSNYWSINRVRVWTFIDVAGFELWVSTADALPHHPIVNWGFVARTDLLIAILATPLTLLMARRWIHRWRRRRRDRMGLCRNCGYDLRASMDRCPECGEPVSSFQHAGRP